MVNAHRQVKAVEHMAGRTKARGLTDGARAVGTVAQDGDRPRLCRSKVVQHPAQLLRLVVGLVRHAGEDPVFAIVVAGLRDHDLEGPHLTARYRSDVAGVDGQRDRAGRDRRRGSGRCRRLTFQPCADPQGALPDGLHDRRGPEREEGIQQCASTPVSQPCAHLGEGALIFWRAAIWHDLADWREGLAMGHAASTGGETGRTNCHDPEQRAQLPGTPVLQRPLHAASRAAAPAATVFFRLCLNEVALQLGQQLFGLRLRQAQGHRRAGVRETASDMNLVGLHAAVRTAQLHHHAPLHPTLTFRSLADITVSFGVWLRSHQRGCYCANGGFVSTQPKRRAQAGGPTGPPTFSTVSYRQIKRKFCTIVGGVVSPLLSNILLTPFDKEMRQKGYRLTRWADDWVVTCRTRAEAENALAQATKILDKLGVTLNREKTRIVHISKGFEFLGFKIQQGKNRFKLSRDRIKSRLNRQNLYAIPTQKSLDRFKDQIRALTKRQVPLRLGELIQSINPVIRGWGVIAHPPPGCIKIMFIKGLSIQASSEPILSILARSAWVGIRGSVLK